MRLWLKKKDIKYKIHSDPKWQWDPLEVATFVDDWYGGEISTQMLKIVEDVGLIGFLIWTTKSLKITTEN